ncbi:MAG: RNA-dependent DNA polymerase [Deltaproteobacteria bacterium CG2_30_63_29]|nr:MAG: RNA-dependent DNA polymerase [Deltaproteobacteria bacterium CG2_30_63_29]PJB38677.1 MAG: RNA-directed DNA polymerase [Deltaproteobacteria bacterium CG_4_9_14_3_um_filter_63_12]
MATTTPNYDDLWRSIAQAGGIDAYVTQQLKERGFLTERSDASQMSKNELKRYKASLKAEAAEKLRLKKEAWLAYRSQHIVHLGEGMYWNDAADIDGFDLAEPEARASENELPQLDNPKQLADALSLTVADVRWLSYHRDAARSLHYRRFTIPKKSGGERPIWAPMPKLKAAQRWIARHIVERLPVHGHAHAFLPARSINTNAKQHIGSKMVLQMDLVGFFPTVTFPRVKGIFRKAGYREQIATLLAAICTEAPREVLEHEGKTWFIAMGPRALPQGAPTSPGLTNTLCLRLDRRLTALAAKLGWNYTRYADDLTFSLLKSHKGKPNLGALMGCIKKVVTDEGFVVNADKTRVSRKGGRQKVTGLVVNGVQPPRVPREFKRRLRAAIHRLENGGALFEGETLDTLKGQAAYVFMTDPELGRKMLERLAKLG